MGCAVLLRAGLRVSACVFIAGLYTLTVCLSKCVCLCVLSGSWSGLWSGSHRGAAAVMKKS